MKITFTMISKGVMTLLLVLAMVSCGSRIPDPSAVSVKIDGGQTLSESDYTSMIDYCGKYAAEAQKYFDIINAQPSDSTAAAVKATGDLADLYARYTYLDQFRNTLSQTDVSAMGAGNEKKVNEYARYQAFPLPVGEGADLRDPAVVGMIQDMPLTDTAQEISTGDGEAVHIDVK